MSAFMDSNSVKNANVKNMEMNNNVQDADKANSKPNAQEVNVNVEVVPLPSSPRSAIASSGTPPPPARAPPAPPAGPSGPAPAPRSSTRAAANAPVPVEHVTQAKTVDGKKLKIDGKNREQLLKGNIKFVYEQVGELLKENTELREQLVMTKMEMRNLQADLNQKEDETAALLDKMQKRATVSNDDYESMLNEIGLEKMSRHSHSAATPMASAANSNTEAAAVAGLDGKDGEAEGEDNKSRSRSDFVYVTNSKANAEIEALRKQLVEMTKALEQSEKINIKLAAREQARMAAESVTTHSGPESTEVSSNAGSNVGNASADHAGFSGVGSGRRSRTHTYSDHTSGAETAAPVPVPTVNYHQFAAGAPQQNYSAAPPGLGKTASNPQGHMPEPMMYQPSSASFQHHQRAQHYKSASRFEALAPQPQHSAASATSSASSVMAGINSPPNPLVLPSPQHLAAVKNRLLDLCRKHGVDLRTIEWFLMPENAMYWETLARKLEEIDRRSMLGDGHFKVKNPSAWLTKFFNTVRKQGLQAANLHMQLSSPAPGFANPNADKVKGPSPSSGIDYSAFPLPIEPIAPSVRHAHASRDMSAAYNPDMDLYLNASAMSSAMDELPMPLERVPTMPY